MEKTNRQKKNEMFEAEVEVERHLKQQSIKIARARMEMSPQAWDAMQEHFAKDAEIEILESVALARETAQALAANGYQR